MKLAVNHMYVPSHLAPSFPLVGARSFQNIDPLVKVLCLPSLVSGHICFHTLLFFLEES
jgi:hypothetical protein